MALQQKLIIRKASLGTTSLLVGAAVTGIALSYAWGYSRANVDDSLASVLPSPVEAGLYRKAKLISSRSVGASARLMKFRVEGPGVLPLKPFSHVEMRGITRDVPPEYPFGLKVERKYSPISASKHDFEILVKSYPVDFKNKERAFERGITSRFLSNLQTGQTVDIKGPFPTVEDDVLKEAIASRKYVGMVCGGSGITPMIQLLGRLTSADSSRRFSLLWSNKSVDDMFFKKELESITKSMKNVTVRYTLTRMAPSGWQHDTGRVSRELLRARMPPPSPDTLIVVCGPDSFVEAVAGGRKSSDGKWHGPLGGFLKDLGYTSEHVVRL